MSSSESLTKTPTSFLTAQVGSQVVVRLKWGNEYRGTLASYDPYFNVHLSRCEEYVNNKLAGELGDVLIRCNNIMYIRSPEPQ